jgi:hypothetical protein
MKIAVMEYDAVLSGNLLLRIWESRRFLRNVGVYQTIRCDIQDNSNLSKQ